jgi:hypothetical protein
MTDDQPKLILTPYDGGRGAHTPGAVPVMADCGHQCWISMGGIQSQASMGARTECMDCVDPNDVPEMVVTPEVYKDLVDAVGMAEADRLIELAKDPKMRAKMLGGGRRGR